MLLLFEKILKKWFELQIEGVVGCVCVNHSLAAKFKKLKSNEEGEWEKEPDNVAAL